MRDLRDTLPHSKNPSLTRRITANGGNFRFDVDARLPPRAHDLADGGGEHRLVLAYVDRLPPCRAGA